MDKRRTHLSATLACHVRPAVKGDGDVALRMHSIQQLTHKSMVFNINSFQSVQMFVRQPEISTIDVPYKQQTMDQVYLNHQKKEIAHVNLK